MISVEKRGKKGFKTSQLNVQWQSELRVCCVAQPESERKQDGRWERRKQRGKRSSVRLHIKYSARGSAFVSVSRIYKHCVHCLHFFFARDLRMIAQDERVNAQALCKNCFLLCFFMCISTLILFLRVKQRWREAREKKRRERVKRRDERRRERKAVLVFSLRFEEMTQPPMSEDTNKPWNWM